MSKILTTLVASLFALSAFAADVPKSDAKAVEAKPAAAVTAPAPETKKEAPVAKAKEHKHHKAKKEAKEAEKHSQAGHMVLAKKGGKKHPKHA